MGSAEGIDSERLPDPDYAYPWSLLGCQHLWDEGQSRLTLPEKYFSRTFALDPLPHLEAGELAEKPSNKHSSPDASVERPCWKNDSFELKRRAT
jgi:hypothetical protein